MELLSDSEHETLQWIRKRFAERGNQSRIEILTEDMELLLRYIGELEAERWSHHHG